LCFKPEYERHQYLGGCGNIVAVHPRKFLGNLLLFFLLAPAGRPAGPPAGSRRIAFPLFCGRFGLPIPREVPLRVVFGAPLTFPDSSKNATAAGTTGDGGKATGLREVSDEELKKAHGEYVAALRRLFDDNKARFGYADRELVIL